MVYNYSNNHSVYHNYSCINNTFTITDIVTVSLTPTSLDVLELGGAYITLV